MDLINKYRLVIAVVLPILILVLLRSLGVNHFKNNVKRWAEPSVKQSNTIDIKQSDALSGKKLIINLDNDVIGIREISADAQNIPADSVLTKKYFKIIRKHDGPVLLFSSQPSVSARIWMILSQMGFNNTYILTNNKDNEVFKYKFRPDTLSLRPEL